MKKIIVALDGLKLSEPAVQYAVAIAASQQAHLVGVFLDDVTYHSYKVYELTGTAAAMQAEQAELEAGDVRKRATAVAYFTAACNNAPVNYSVHHDRNFPLEELLHESIFADLLIIEARETLANYAERPPSGFVKDLLAAAHCPVLVVPHQYRSLQQACLLYDGRATSVFAIRMFCYFFAGFQIPDIEVISVNKPGHSSHVPDNRLLKEFMKRHIPHARYTVLKGDPDVEIHQHLQAQDGHTLLVLGDSHRNMVSRWFRPAMSHLLLTSLRMPLFFARAK